MAIPVYSYFAKVEGLLSGATVEWEWEFDGIAPPNIFPTSAGVLITTQSDGEHAATPPYPGTLTLSGKVKCGSAVMSELDTITLTIGVDYVAPSEPCCPQTTNCSLRIVLEKLDFPVYGFDCSFNPDDSLLAVAAGWNGIRVYSTTDWSIVCEIDTAGNAYT